MSVNFYPVKLQENRKGHRKYSIQFNSANYHTKGKYYIILKMFTETENTFNLFLQPFCHLNVISHTKNTKSGQQARDWIGNDLHRILFTLLSLHIRVTAQVCNTSFLHFCYLSTCVLPWRPPLTLSMCCVHCNSCYTSPTRPVFLRSQSDIS